MRIGSKTVQLDTIEFLLARNKLQHCIEEVLPGEVVKGLLSVPLLLVHVQAALLTIVTLQKCTHHEKPTGTPLHLLRSQLCLQCVHFFLELAEMVAIKFEEFLELVRLKEQA